MTRALVCLSLCFAASAWSAEGDNDTLTIAAVGDIMLGSSFPAEAAAHPPPDDGEHLLDEVSPALHAADLAFGNLEGPLYDGDAPKNSKCGRKQTKSCWAFRVPTSRGRWLKEAGFTVLGLANNHAMDMGDPGRKSSLDTLDALGIAHSGPVGDVAHLSIKGKKVALIAFATYDHGYNLLHLPEATAAIAAERKANDLVIVSFHGGGEGAKHQHVPPGVEMFYKENRGDLRKFTHAAIDAGAALVIGHGPHVVRGLELYKGHLIAYSLGNFATWGGMSLAGPDGVAMILEATLGADGRFVSGRAHPVTQTPPGGPKLDPAGQIIPILQQLSADDFGHAAPVIGDDGTISAPGTTPGATPASPPPSPPPPQTPAP